MPLYDYLLSLRLGFFSVGALICLLTLAVCLPPSFSGACKGTDLASKICFCIVQ